MEQDIKDTGAEGLRPEEASAVSGDVPEPCAAEAEAEAAQTYGAGRIRELEEKAARADEYHDLLLRTRAEFDNFRKRIQRETAQTAKLASESLLSQLLPVADNFERALVIAVAHENDEQTSKDMKSFIQGVRLTHKQLLDVMSRSGLERIDTAGAVFDPRFHEAMAVVETADMADGAIVDEFQAGYRLGDRIVRPAAVRIARAPSAGTAGDGNGQTQSDSNG